MDKRDIVHCNSLFSSPFVHKPAILSIILNKLNIFFERQAVLLYDSRMGIADISEMPWLVGNARNLLFILGIALDETVIRSYFSELIANTVIWKFGADKINVSLIQG